MNKVKLTALMAAAAMVAMPSVASADVVFKSDGGGFFGGDNSLFGGYGITAVGGSLGDTEAASPTDGAEFTLTGVVNADCSFFSGNRSATRNIDFGTIGIRTNSNVNVANAFDMRAPAGVVITTSTAGCNTNNTVTIEKGNIEGMVNSAPGDYDSDEFTANLEYTVNAQWEGVAVGSGGVAGETQTLSIDRDVLGDDLAGGAWRSRFTMGIVIPTPAKGLVAGEYTDTLTVTLAAQI